MEIRQNLLSAARTANESLRYCNVYRAAEFLVARAESPFGYLSATLRMHNLLCGEFETHDQDTRREEWAAKTQLSYMSPIMSASSIKIVQFCGTQKIQNPAVLHELHKLHEVLVGPRSSPRESLAYIRRAARKLHPDKTRHLDGWVMPPLVPAKHLPPCTYEHAKEGAKALFALHLGLRHLLYDPHYQRLLWSPAIQKGGRLSPADVARDACWAALISACLVVTKKLTLRAALGLSTAGYVLAAAMFICNWAKKRRQRREEVTCREMVLFRPQTTGV